MQNGFGAPLRLGYLAEQDVEAVYLASHGPLAPILGGAVVLRTPWRVPFLSKLWVEPAHRRQGHAAKLWAALEDDFPTFFWRSLADNPARPWYEARATGVHNIGHRAVYWRGLPAEIGQMIPWAYNLPFDFEAAQRGAA